MSRIHNINPHTMLRKSSGPPPRKARPPRLPQRKSAPFGAGRPIRTALLWLILVLGVILFVQIYGEIKAKTHEIPYSEFLSQVDTGNIKAVTIVDREVVGELKQSALTHEEGRPASYVFFKVYLPAEDKDLGRAILAKSPDTTVNSKPPGMNWWSLALSYLPFVALLVLWMFMIRQIQSGGANAMKFGKSRPKVVMENSPKVTFKDVAGADEAKQELEEIIEFLRDPKKFQRLGGRIPKGALLLGPPGTGKTLLAKAVAGEAGVPFFSLAGPDCADTVVGVGASRGREGILRVHTRNIPVGEDVNLNTIARGTPGMVGADLANPVNEAALLAARRNHKRVSAPDFEDAKDKVMMGTERRSLVISDEEKKSTSYHEAGHALMAWLQPGSDKVHKVTIIPRGRALGLTAYLPQDERHSFSREYWLRVLTHLMGGRAAEQIVLSQLTTGASDDIRRATNIARRMVCEWGMSERLGPLTFGTKEEFVFLGREISQHRDYSEKTAIMIDEEVRSLVDGAYNHARQLLMDNLDKLHVLAMALLEREMLDGEEVEKVLRGEKLDPLPRPQRPSDGQDQSGAAQPAEERPARESHAPRIKPSDSPGIA